MAAKKARASKQPKGKGSPSSADRGPKGSGKAVARKSASAKAAKAEAKPSKPAKAEAKPSKPAKAEAKPSKPAKAEAKPSKAAKPEAKPSKAAKPEAKPSKAAKPEAKPPSVAVAAKPEAPKAKKQVEPSPGKAPKADAARPSKPLTREAPKVAPARPSAIRPAVGRLPLPTREVQRERVATLPLPMGAPVRKPSMEARLTTIEERLTRFPDEVRKAYELEAAMAWIFHDAELEGTAYPAEELHAALTNQAVPPDSSLKPVYEEIRRYRDAIDFVQDQARKKAPVTVDLLRHIFFLLHPEDGDPKAVKYRKDVPQHRLYFHEYADPEKIQYKVRHIVDWANDPEIRKTRSQLRIAARTHYDLMRVFPFAVDSGRVARLFLNFMLLRAGLPLAIISHSERQRYYDALKGSAQSLLQIVQDAMETWLSSVEKRLAERETRTRGFVT